MGSTRGSGFWITSSELVTSTVNERSTRKWYLNFAVKGGNRDWAMGSTWARLVGGRETLVRIKHVKRETQPRPGLGEKVIDPAWADKPEQFEFCSKKPWEAHQDSHSNYFKQTNLLVSILRIKPYWGGIASGVCCLGRRKSWVNLPGHISSWISGFWKKQQL